MGVGVYLDREAMEIIQTVREKLARQLGVSEKHISPSMVVKYLYSQAYPKNTS
ncbi:hypothetical protein [Thermococcus sp. JdF3]|uniref:hypothetical protein n=1 Tax=Thermococcus sp. JdF3 TaxID=1638258 RepID=UPI001438FAF2|nr:hypothetical protein [Thermococcus sp. JdF3]